jgi:hypothetical protein
LPPRARGVRRSRRPVGRLSVVPRRARVDLASEVISQEENATRTCCLVDALQSARVRLHRSKRPPRTPKRSRQGRLSGSGRLIPRLGSLAWRPRVRRSRRPGGRAKRLQGLRIRQSGKSLRRLCAMPWAETRRNCKAMKLHTWHSPCRSLWKKRYWKRCATRLPGSSMSNRAQSDSPQ